MPCVQTKDAGDDDNDDGLLLQRGAALFSRPRAPFQTQNGASPWLVRAGRVKSAPAKQDDLNELAEIAKTGLCCSRPKTQALTLKQLPCCGVFSHADGTEELEKD
eukprot:150354-Rhodomonas_salina.1